MPGSQWTVKEVNYLKNNYSDTSKEDLVKVLSRTWPSILQKAQTLSLKKTPTTVGNMYNLLNDSLESFYWLGFLLADGHFSNTGRIQLRIKDHEHLCSFSKFMGNTAVKKLQREGRSVHYFTDIQNPKCMSIIKNKYGIRNNKTICPPIFNMWNLSKEQWLSLFIGFFDGDGCVFNRVDVGFRGGIKVHSKWLDAMVFLNSKVLQIINSNDKHIPYIANNGYVQCNISAESLRKLKDFSVNRNLPVLVRKWNRVTTSKQKIVVSRELLVALKYTDNLTKLSKDTGIAYSTLYGRKQKLNKLPKFYFHPTLVKCRRPANA